jgi:hypothetical protein
MELEGHAMRIESSVTSISWIPSEAISSLAKVPFEKGITHYDEPPPDKVTDLEELRRADRFRFANELRGFIEVEDGRITGSGQSGSGHIGSTTVRLGGRSMVFAAVSLPDLRSTKGASETEVTFVQTAGGHTGVPAPRSVKHPPFVQFAAPVAWTTLALTIRADGSSQHHLVGASTFPRHWIYDDSGMLSAKSGLVDFSTWMASAFGKYTPWGDEESEALTTQVESALERELSLRIMHGGAKPAIRSVAAGAVITEQGTPGEELFLVLDGVVRVEVDGEQIAEYGPGSIHGERAVLEGGLRTSTIRAVTTCKLAVVLGDQLEEQALVELSEGHRREEGG